MAYIVIDIIICKYNIPCLSVEERGWRHESGCHV